MTEKLNYPVVTPYPQHFWHDALGCHWCGRITESMISGHDGMCPVPVVAQLEERVRELEKALGWVRSPCRVDETTTVTHCNGCEELHELERICKETLGGE